MITMRNQMSDTLIVKVFVPPKPEKEKPKCCHIFLGKEKCPRCGLSKDRKHEPRGIPNG